MVLEPQWVAELLGAWAASEWAGPRAELGYPAAASFSPLPDHDAEGVAGVSPAEIRAVAMAIDWLALAHPDHWRALNIVLRPRLMSGHVRGVRDDALIAECAPMIAAYIDRVLG